MFEAGKKFRHLIQFTSGQPTSNLVYSVKRQDGTVVTSGTVAITSGQLSYLVEIAANLNTLTKPLFEQLTLEWEYTTATQAVDESITYTIHAPLGFPVSHEGVRMKLGVSDEELPDDDISLFEGYVSFKGLVGEDTDLSAFVTSGNLDSYKITKAIEALAALALIPSLQIRLPKKYDSGTSAYERWNTIDWEGLIAELNNLVAAGLDVVITDFDYYSDNPIFVLSDRGPDAITGE